MDSDAPARPDPARTPGPAPTQGNPRPRGAFPLARIGGVPIYLHSSFVLLSALVIIGYGPLARRVLYPLSVFGGYLVALGFVVCLLLSVLLHELGHAVMARRQGIGVRAITLELLGGYTEMTGDSPNPRADALVSLIGPAVSAVIGVLGLWAQLLFPDGIAHELAFQIAWSNLIVAAFNALPGLPLDGGRALRALVWKITDDRNVATTVAGWFGRLVAAVTLAVVVYLSYLGVVNYLSVALAAFVALVVWQGATAAINQAKVATRLPSVDLRRLARPLIVVPVGTPLAEALRRRDASGWTEAAIALTDGAGRLVALVSEREAAKVPVEQRPWVAVDQAALTLESRQTLAVDLAGEDVVAAVQAHPAPNYLVVSGESVVGVLRTTDLVRMLNS
jgi:Zn-dependent protease